MMLAASSRVLFISVIFYVPLLFYSILLFLGPIYKVRVNGIISA